MNKQKLIREIHEDTGYTQTTVDIVIRSFCNRIEKNLCLGEKITVTGFGTFEMEVKTRGDKQIFKPVFKFSKTFEKAVQEE